MKKKLKSYKMISTDGDTGKKTYRNFMAYNSKDALQKMHKYLKSKKGVTKVTPASERAKKLFRKTSRPAPRRPSMLEYL